MADLATVSTKPNVASSATPHFGSSSLRYAFTIFLSAFLLFAVQLMLGKYFLPWFGGTPAMWTTCMLFFQILLLAGYVYAHILITRFDTRRQALVHLTLLTVSAVLMIVLAFRWHSPLLPTAIWKPSGSGSPVWSILVLLSVSVGVPYLALSSTGPLLQGWFSRTHPGVSPYRLYALSNVGSLLALISYPFLIETHLSLQSQARVWALAFFAFAVSCVACARWAARTKSPENFSASIRANESAELDGAKPRFSDQLFWAALTACASVMFLATTSQICQDVAVVPLLWVLPLGVYLLSFVICFDKSKWYRRAVYHPALVLAFFLTCFVLNGGARKSLIAQMLIYVLTLFVCCMVCHGELVRSKPASRYLTSFYLMVSIGGAAGGIFVVLIAPHIFPAYWEYHVALWATALLLFVALMRDKTSWLYISRFGIAAIALVASTLPGLVAWATTGTTSAGYWLPAAMVLIAVGLLVQKSREGYDPSRARAVPWYCAITLLVAAVLLITSANLGIRSAVSVSRDFYGVLSIKEVAADQPELKAFSLSHGRITHGFQFQQADKRHIPTTYYEVSSGVGRALHLLQSRDPQPLRIGVVGLGIGTLAAYGRSGDSVRFYEISPAIIRIANDQRYFTYLHDTPATISIVEGDARLSMERELVGGRGERFDLLAIDAFSGDATPVHLLTQEAFQIYLNQIRPDGIIAVHITNTYLDFRPVVAAAAAHFNLASVFIHSDGDKKATGYNDWVLLSRDKAMIDSLSAAGTPMETRPDVAAWTDDHSNLFQILRSRR